jgi:hypothetical protein
MESRTLARQDMQPLALTEPEIDDVVAFLASLTSPQYKAIGDQEYATATRSIQSEPPSAGYARTFGPKPKQPEPPPVSNFIRLDCSDPCATGLSHRARARSCADAMSELRSICCALLEESRNSLLYLGAFYLGEPS